MKNILILCVFLLIFASDFTNNGVPIFIDSEVTVAIDGSFENNGAITNNGVIQFNNDFINNDTIQFNESSLVVLAGDSLLFSGCSFWGLTIEGIGVNSLQNNAIVRGDFTFNSGVLELNGDTLEIFGEIYNNGGIVIGDGEILHNGFDVYACTDSLALNFSETSIFDDGSCDYPPLISLNESMMDFGNISFYEEETHELIINNQGYYPLEISASVTQPNLSLVQDSLLIAPSDTAVITIVLYAFIEEMEISTNLELITNDPFQPVINIPIFFNIESINQPVITLIEDVPYDQGGWVRVHFTRSYHDTDSLRNPEQYTVEVNDGNGWTFMSSATAYNESVYQAIIHTTIDSSSTSDGLIDFRVIAGMEEGNFVSETVQGYSVDNIVPTEPVNLTSEISDNAISLNWSANVDDDLSQYHIYKNQEFIQSVDISEFIDENAEPGLVNYSVSAVDIHGNESNRSEISFYIPYHFTHEINAGNNLLSFPGHFENNETQFILENLIESGSNVLFILGQGLGLFNTSDGWSGNLNQIQSSAGYWLNTAGSHQWSLLFEYGDIKACDNYETVYGNNLLSFKWGNGNQSTLEALGGVEFATDNFKFILGQGVGLFKTNTGWNGNLNELQEGKGYWVNVSSNNLEFKWGFENCENPEINPPLLMEEQLIQIPEEYQFIQSTQQAFYLIKEIEDVENGDMILAYCGEQLVGSAIWTGEYTAIPVMGRDISEQTIGFCDTGEQPIFTKINPLSNENIELIGDIPGFTNLGVYTLDKLESIENINIPTEWSLAPAYPNPFNPVTTIHFGVPLVETLRPSTHSGQTTSLRVYDINGRLIETLVDGKIEAGFHTIEWDATGNPSGLYFVKLQSEGFTQTQKLMLVK